MRLLLDTQALLVWIGDVATLPRAARAAVQDPQATVLVSIASLWEATIKRALCKL